MPTALPFLVLAFWAFPCFVIGLLASPLCGAGTLTFFAAAKKVSKESGFTPLNLKWVPWRGGDGGAINGSHLGPLVSVTQPSSAPTPHCVRRMGLPGKTGASFVRGGGHRLRIGEAPKDQSGWFGEVPPRRAQRRRKHDGLVTHARTC